MVLECTFVFFPDNTSLPIHTIAEIYSRNKVNECTSHFIYS